MEEMKTSGVIKTWKNETDAWRQTKRRMETDKQTHGNRLMDAQRQTDKWTQTQGGWVKGLEGEWVRG